MLTKSLLLLLLVSTCSVDAYQPKFKSYVKPNTILKSSNIDENKGIQNPLPNIPPVFAKSLSAIVCAAALLGNPADSFAARSGGRSGGSSFSAPRSSSSSTRMYSTRTSYASPPIVVGSPFGFGYSPFGFGGFGFSPFGFMPINPTVLFLGIAAYAAYTVLQNRIGGSDFSNDGDVGSLGSGASIMKIQVSLDDNWAKEGNIMQILSDLSNRSGLISGRSDISSLLSEASLTLLRRQNDWNSAAFKGELFNGGNAEQSFNKLAVTERAKFESENSVASRNAGITNSIVEGKPTQAVVSILVAIRGRSDVVNERGVSSIPDVKKVLQTLASEALTDNGENIMAVEVLWTPSEPGDVLTERDIIEDYPELLRL